MLSSSKPINIIIVDDNLDNLEVIKEVLERPGVNILTSDSPADVLNICISAEISIALIDVKMPVMSGFDLLNQLKGNPLTENVVVILMTGYSMNTDEVFLGLSSGAVDYLFKPLDMHITTAKVNSLLTMINYQRDIEQKNKELEYFQSDLYHAVEEAKKGKVIKENFLANMSHEIRTPLNAIVGITNLLRTSGLNPIQMKMMELMDFSSSALLGIVNDILESFQIDAGKIILKPVSTDISALFKTVGDTMRPLAEEKGLSLNYKIEGEVPDFIKADPLRVKQVLMNLINNAIKFTATGGIDLTLKAVASPESHVDLEFIVKDSGLGIPENAISQIFERFEQIEDKTWQKFGGTGLGLSIVKRLVELMGGKIEVSSILDTGTTFTFTGSFELARTVAAGEADPIITSLNTLSDFVNISILLVEDNKINQFIAVRMLEGWNVKVDVAEDGLEAFHKLMLGDYDLVLMDTHMPVMNGIEATRKIRKELSSGKNKTPIISFSASVIEHEKQEAMDAGVNDFLEKPFHPKILHEKITRLTGVK
jgi:signal transduction histidine kinase